MAKEQVSTLVKVVIGIILFGITVWGIAWASGRNVSAHAGLVSSHEVRITKNESEISTLDNRLDSTEKMQISLAKDQQAILSGQNDLKAQQSKMHDIMIEGIKSDAEIKAWIKSIEKVE